MNSIGYILAPKKADQTEVIMWTEFDDKKQSKLFKKTADRILTGLKTYAEYIEGGGDPDHAEAKDYHELKQTLPMIDFEKAVPGNFGAAFSIGEGTL